MDVDSSRNLCCDEICFAMKKLVCAICVAGFFSLALNCLLQDFRPRIHLTESDFMVFTDNGVLCDDKGMMGPHEFEVAMRKQIRLYAQRQLADTLLDDTLEATDLSQLAALKILLREDHSFDHATHTMAGTGGHGVKEDIGGHLSSQMCELQRAVAKVQESLSSLRPQSDCGESVKRAPSSTHNGNGGPLSFGEADRRSVLSVRTEDLNVLMDMLLPPCRYGKSVHANGTDTPQSDDQRTLGYHTNIRGTPL